MIIKFNSVLILLLSINETHPFTIHSQLSHSAAIRHDVYSKASVTTTTLNHHEHENQDENENIRETNGKRKFAQKRLRTFGQVVMERSDTMSSAGLYGTPTNTKDEPLMAGAKTNITLFVVALGYKWYRSIFINKMAIWERQPQWNTVITSKEDEEKAKLEALTCNNCGATIFIAKGRKWFQMPRGYECYCCGASGNENFENTRDDLIEEIDDDYFDYEKPLDFVTAAERKKLMKEAGGDEDKAIALLTQQNMEAAEAEVAAGGDEAPKKKKKKKKKKKGKKKKKSLEGDDGNDDNANGDNIKSDDASPTAGKGPEKKKQVDDDIDLLDMD